LANLSAHTYKLSFNWDVQPGSSITSALVSQTLGQFAGMFIYTVSGAKEGEYKFNQEPVGKMISVTKTQDGDYLATCLLNDYLNPALYAVEPVYSLLPDNYPAPYCLVLRPLGQADSFASFFYAPGASAEGQLPVSPEPAPPAFEQQEAPTAPAATAEDTADQEEPDPLSEEPSDLD